MLLNSISYLHRSVPRSVRPLVSIRQRSTWYNDKDKKQPIEYDPRANLPLQERAKTWASTAFVLGGVLVMGGLLYVVFSDLTSDTGANKVYLDLLKDLEKYPQVEQHVGIPLKGVHEHHSRARGTQRVNQQTSEDGQRMQLRFIIEGPTKKAAEVTAEMHLLEGSGKKAKWEPYVLYMESEINGRHKRVFLVDKRPPSSPKRGKRRPRPVEANGEAPAAPGWLPKLGLDKK